MEAFTDYDKARLKHDIFETLLKHPPDGMKEVSIDTLLKASKQVYEWYVDHVTEVEVDASDSKDSG